MSTPLLPELAQLERELESTRAALPASLRAKVLAAAAAARARPMVRVRTNSFGWFAASLAIAAALLLSLSNSGKLVSPEPLNDASDACMLVRALHESPDRCFETSRDQH